MRALFQHLLRGWGRLRELLELDPPRCGVCGEPVDRAAAFWAPHLNAWVDPECIPAIARRRGVDSIWRWLRLGTL